MADEYIKALYGQHARQAAFNYVIQRGDAKHAAIVGITSMPEPMMFGASSDAPHVLVLCDAVIRPHLVIESRHLVGAGLSGIIRSELSDVDDWLKHGKIIVNNMPKSPKVP